MGSYDEELTDDQIAYARELANTRRGIWRDHMDKTTPLKKSAERYISPIDEGELAIRMAEAAIGIKRPPGKTVQECLDSFPADWGEGFHRAARAAMLYWKECIDTANTSQ